MDFEERSVGRGLETGIEVGVNGGGIIVAANGGVSDGACPSYEWGLICSRVEEELTTMAGTQLGSFDERKTRVYVEQKGVNSYLDQTKLRLAGKSRDPGSSANHYHHLLTRRYYPFVAMLWFKNFGDSGKFRDFREFWRKLSRTDQRREPNFVSHSAPDILLVCCSQVAPLLGVN